MGTALIRYESCVLYIVLCCVELYSSCFRKTALIWYEFCVLYIVLCCVELYSSCFRFASLVLYSLRVLSSIDIFLSLLLFRWLICRSWQQSFCLFVKVCLSGLGVLLLIVFLNGWWMSNISPPSFPGEKCKSWSYFSSESNQFHCDSHLSVELRLPLGRH